MCAITQRFDLLTDGAHLLFRGMRLHDNQHDPTSERRVYQFFEAKDQGSGGGLKPGSQALAQA
jgi:hypothetical protein